MADSSGSLKKNIQTPNGKGKVEKIYITELGYVMAKVKFRKNGVANYINYTLGSLQKNEDTQDVFFI